MRRQITDSEDNQNTELPELTEQQRNFVFAILQGNSASDAYRIAYDCQNSKPTTIWVEASRTKNLPSVALWLAAARKAYEGKASCTLEQHKSELVRLRELAIEKGNLGAAIQAENFRGRVEGHYTDRLTVTEGDPLEFIKQIARINPTIAQQLAEREGLPTDGLKPH